MQVVVDGNKVLKETVGSLTDSSFSFLKVIFKKKVIIKHIEEQSNRFRIPFKRISFLTKNIKVKRVGIKNREGEKNLANNIYVNLENHFGIVKDILIDLNVKNIFLGSFIREVVLNP